MKTTKNDNILGRLILLSELSGLNQKELAGVLGYRDTYISDVLRKKKAPGKGFGSKVELLLREYEKVEVPAKLIAASGQVPVGDLADQIDEQCPSNCKDPNAFALIVEGDSMEPDFKAGTRVVCAPNNEARNGDYVVARLRVTGGVLFKLHHRTGPDGKIVRLTRYPARRGVALDAGQRAS